MTEAREIAERMIERENAYGTAEVVVARALIAAEKEIRRLREGWDGWQKQALAAEEELERLRLMMETMRPNTAQEAIEVAISEPAPPAADAESVRTRP